MTQCHGIWETVVFFEHIVNAINFMFFTSMKSHATSYFGSVVLHQTGIWLNRYSSVHIFLNQKKKKKSKTTAVLSLAIAVIYLALRLHFASSLPMVTALPFILVLGDTKKVASPLNGLLCGKARFKNLAVLLRAFSLYRVDSHTHGCVDLQNVRGK